MHYYQHHIGDFIRDTANLSDSQAMAYLRLIWMYYDSEKPLPNNAKVLAFKIGSTEETVSLILEAFFTQENDVWRHSRCESELAEYNAIRERNIANGKSGGRPKKTQSEPSGFPVGSQKEPKNTGFSGEKIRSGPGNTETEPAGLQVGTQSEPSGFPVGFQSEPSRNPNHEPVTNLSTTDVVESEGTPKQHAEKNSSSSGTRLPNDWVLPREWGLWAVAEGLTEAQVRATADTFRDHWISKAGKEARKADWLATWRNWVRRDLSKLGGSYGNSGHEKRQPVDNSAPARVARAIAKRDSQLGESVPPDDFIELGSSDYQAVSY